MRTAREILFRIAASGYVPASLYLREVPDRKSLAARTGLLSLEIVSHCWNYSHLLAYQLSSLVLHPPTRLAVKMTVFYSGEDPGTVALLEFFDRQVVPGVKWNWQKLPTPELMRRAIGRNRAARASRADWVWFTDCDVVFYRGCLDALAASLQGRQDPLVFPEEEQCTGLLRENHPILSAATGPRIVDIDPSDFSPKRLNEAKGPMQITHGDVARACGYCEELAVYQEPSERWRKNHEDRAFRWLLRTKGVGINVPGVYRLRHLDKGRYGSNPLLKFLRATIRRAGSRLADE